MGDLVQFPAREELQGPIPKTCWTCRNAMFGEQGTYCTTFSEVILSEVAAAQDCEVYDSIDEVRKP